MPTPRTPVSELATRYDGVVTQAALVAAGYHHTLAHDAAVSGRWKRLLPGIYLTEPGPGTLRQRCHAALLHAGPQGAITGRAGCALRGFATAGDDVEVTVVVPASVTRVRAEFCHLVRARKMPDYQLLRRNGLADLRVVRLERCLIDAVRRTSDPSEALAVALRVRAFAGVEWSEVEAAARRPGPGAGHLASVVRHIADGVRSPAEADLHDLLLPAGRRGMVPPYLLNPDLFLDGVLIGSPDAWFPGLGLGDEVDSRQWHGSEDALDGTLLRHERFDGHGLHLCHVTPSRLRADSRGHLTTLREQLARRRALAVPEPPGLVVLARGPLLPARTPWPGGLAHRM